MYVRSFSVVFIMNELVETVCVYVCGRADPQICIKLEK